MMEKIYICNACHPKAIQGKVPCQATVNNLCVDDVPTELESLKKLEQSIIAQWIVFEEIGVMSKGQQRKIKEQSVMYQLIVIKHVIYCLVPLKDLVLFFEIEKKNSV